MMPRTRPHPPTVAMTTTTKMKRTRTRRSEERRKKRYLKRICERSKNIKKTADAGARKKGRGVAVTGRRGGE